MAEGKLKGTIRFYGTPAEEAVGGKIYMVREGVFKDLDVCLTWHPDEKTRASVDGSQAIIDFIVEFSGRTSHAAADPWNGRSAVAAMELFTAGLNRMREFVKPTVRMHYSILERGRRAERGAGLRQALVLAARFEGRRGRTPARPRRAGSPRARP